MTCLKVWASDDTDCFNTVNGIRVHAIPYKRDELIEIPGLVSIP